jgi:hypothetical protein
LLRFINSFFWVFLKKFNSFFYFIHYTYSIPPCISFQHLHIYKFNATFKWLRLLNSLHVQWFIHGEEVDVPHLFDYYTLALITNKSTENTWKICDKYFNECNRKWKCLKKIIIVVEEGLATEQSVQLTIMF